MAIEMEIWIKMAAFAGGGICMGLGAIGSAIGEGYAAASANEAISRSPDQAGDIFKSMLVGQAVAESAGIFALVVSMILLFSNFGGGTWVDVSVVFSAGLCMGMGAIGAGVGSGFPAGAACQGMSRQPAVGSKLTTNMLIGSAVCQTPSIFALVTAFILIYTDFSGSPVNPTWAALLGAGLASGVGAIGSGLGGGLAAQGSCEGISRQPESLSAVTILMLLGQAITQSPAIFGLLVSFMLIFKTYPPTEAIAPAAALLSAGLCVGFGAIGPALGGGEAARNGVRWVARTPESANEINRVMLVGMAVGQSTVIYALLISLVLIFLV